MKSHRNLLSVTAVTALASALSVLGSGSAVAAESNNAAPAFAVNAAAIESAAAQATERWAENEGVYRSMATLDVSTYANDGLEVVVVRPADIEPVDNVAEVDSKNGAVEVSGVFKVAARPSIASFAASGSASWVKKSSDCLTRDENNTGWIDSCWEINWESDDGSSTKDYWALHHSATAKSKGIWTLFNAFVKSDRDSTSPSSWEWVDWTPGSDLDKGNCTSMNFGVSHIATFSTTYSVCDKWDITKSAAAGSFSNYWRGTAHMSERDVAYTTVIRTSQGSAVVYALSAGFFAL